MFDVLVGWIELFPVWAKAGAGVVVAANAVTILTPSTADNQFLSGVLKVLNAISGNFGKNTNADA